MSIQNPVVVAGVSADVVPAVFGLPLIAGGSAVSVSGTFSASNPSIGLTGAAVPTSGSFVGGVGADGFLHGFLTDNTGQLNVNIVSGGGGGTQYADGATQATPTGTVGLAKNPSNILRSLALDALGSLIVAFPAAQHVIVDSATLGTVVVSQSGTWNIASIANSLPAGSNVIGHVISDATSVTAATLSAETTKVIGTINVAASQTITASQAVAANLNATVVFASPQHTIIDSASLGSVTVAQATASSLNATVIFPSAQHVIIDSATLGTVTVGGTVTANQGGSWSNSIVQSGSALAAGNPLPTQLSDGVQTYDLARLPILLTTLIRQAGITQDLIAAQTGSFVPQTETFLGA